MSDEPNPGVHPDQSPPGPGTRVEVDGEVFVMRPDGQGGTSYDWVSGPNPGYGFGSTPTAGLDEDAHRASIRGFLAEIDPATGYLREE